jgi:branched-chain amino acid transport system substrate-binding protein
MLVLFIMNVGIFGSAAAQQAKTKTIKIGTIMPVSGPLGAIGLAWNRGYELAADMINEKGGINIKGEKYTISLILEDGKMSPEACSAAANKLVYRDGAKFVLGEIMEPDSEAIYNVTKKAKTFFGLAYSTVPTPLGPWGAGANNPLMVLMCTGQYLGFPIVFDYLKEAYPKLKRIVTTDNTFAHEPLIDYSIKNLKERGFEVVGVERFDFAATDYYPFITAVLKHKPEIINICMNGPEQLGRHIRAAREQGFWGPILSTCPIAPNFALMGAGAKMARTSYARRPLLRKQMCLKV